MGSCLLIERFEPRRLLASAGVAIADYHPMTGGNTWAFSGVEDGVATTQTTNSALDNIAGQPVTRFSDVDNEGIATHEYLSLRKDGIRLHAHDEHKGPERIQLVLNTPLRFLNYRVKPADLIPFSKVPVTVNFDLETTGPFNGTGTITGSSRVEGFEHVDLADGRFVDAALKVTLDYTLTVRTEIKDQPVTITEHVIEITWLGKGIGPVRVKSSSQTSFATNDDRSSESSNEDFALIGSSLMPEVSMDLLGGVLQVSGTGKPEILDISANKSDVLVSVGPVTRSFTKSAVTSINISASDGNDVIGIGHGVIGAYVDAGSGNDQLIGGDGKDTLTGGAGKDTINGRSGDDRLNGSGGHDHLIGAEGNDRLYGQNENDTLEGGGGIDRLFGGTGNDLLAGGASNDKLNGEAGDDLLLGQSHDDLLTGGPGADQLAGGDGFDIATVDDLDLLTSIEQS